MKEDRNYYVYAHYRLDNFTPFYIGKGKGDRAYELKRNKHHDSITEKYGSIVAIIKDGLTEEEAFELERDMIEDLVFNEGYGIDIQGYNKYNHKKDNYLTNQSWGGEGSSGYKFSKESKQKMSKRLKKVWENKEYRQKMSEKRRGRNNGMYGKIRRGENSPFYGKHHSEEAKQKMREKKKGRYIGGNNPNFKNGDKIRGEKNPNARKVICEGNIFNTATEFAEYYRLDTATYKSWLSKEHSMPVEWYIKGLRYLDTPIEGYNVRTKQRIVYSKELNRIWLRIEYCANELNIHKDTISRNINKNKKSKGYILNYITVEELFKIIKENKNICIVD